MAEHTALVLAAAPPSDGSDRGERLRSLLDALREYSAEQRRHVQQLLLLQQRRIEAAASPA